jgi:hypothetical protein
MSDAFAQSQSGLSSPGQHAAAVTPDDNTDLATSARALWVGTGGNVALVTVGGETVTITSVPSGSILPVRCSRVKATGTTATGIVALW